MELAKEIIDGLANIQNSNVLPEETFLQLLDTIILCISKNISNGKTPVTAVYPSKSDLIKATFANISCLFIEAARHDYDEESLKHFLCNEHINGQRIETLCNRYISNKESIQTELELMGNNLPHAVDIDWRLHHCIKISTHFTNVPICNIRISTKERNQMRHIIFTCTIQQLQELVYKLKDVVRHIEKISNI